MMRLFLMALALSVLTQGCGSGSLDAVEEEPSSAGCSIPEGGLRLVGHAVHMPTCAPRDGPALDIVLTSERITCDSLLAIWLHGPSERSSFVQLKLNGSFEPIPLVAHDLGSEIDTGVSYSTGGSGRRCMLGECTIVERGTVHFGPAESDNQYLEVRLCFADGTEKTGRYEVHRCEREAICG
ncbi:MAG: hypothetical protein ACI80V_002185 [Rhodothermales bacterium]|jgi:hypothetical protein